MNREELEYSLSSDSASQPYRASGQSRFNTPELVAVMGDVIRRLRLLKGTRASVQRSGFDSDVKALASASLDDFMTATNIAKPNESIATAASRSDMPAKVKTALRTLLLSTSDVPGTEGRKTQLRYNGHAANVFFGAPSFFTTPNFADTYNALVLQLHQGPPDGSHLNINGSIGPAQLDASDGASQPVLPDIAQAEPPMPSLERMHQIVAEDPRAQAKFFLLMTELHYRYIIGVERLRIGRLRLAAPREPHHDEVAATLQPCVAPGTTDVQAPFEGQGRGFVHGHGKGHSSC